MQYGADTQQSPFDIFNLEWKTWNRLSFMVACFEGTCVCVYFPDRCRGPNGQARAEESPHCPADGQAQVQEASAEAPRVRQPLRRHRDEGAGGL